jgi:hypothetical protein
MHEKTMCTFWLENLAKMSIRRLMSVLKIEQVVRIQKELEWFIIMMSFQFFGSTTRKSPKLKKMYER